MHLDGLDLNLLVALDALLTEQNVTRAASRLAVTQPTMSVALQKLRLHLDDALLERVGTKLELTPLARKLAGPVKDILFQIKVAMGRQDSFDPAAASRHFRIVMSQFVAQHFGIAALKKMSEVAPQICCHLDIFVTSDVMVRLHKGEFDFCIAVSSVSGGFQPVTDPTALARDWLFTDHFVLVADARNQMVTDDIDFETFCQLQHVETRFGGGLSSMIERTLLLMPDRPDTTMLVSTYALAIDAIVGTAKTAIVPMMVAQHAARVYDLKIVAQPFVVPDLVESLYWHKRNDADPAHVWVRNFLKSFSEQSDFRAQKCLMAQQA